MKLLTGFFNSDKHLEKFGAGPKHLYCNRESLEASMMMAKIKERKELSVARWIDLVTMGINIPLEGLKDKVRNRSSWRKSMWMLRLTLT